MQPAFNFQGLAIFGVLAFLGSALYAVAATIAMIVLALAGKLHIAKRILQVSVAGAVVYLVLLFGSSAVSTERVLSAGEEKYFCEVDCHVAYSVPEVRQEKALGSSAAQGLYMVVKLRTRFDEKTISARRGKEAPLYPNPRSIVVLDDSGRRFEPSPQGQQALEAAEGKQTPVTQPLKPGESYVTSLVFDLPPNAKNPRLLITESDCVTHLLIGHENSPFHKKASFRLVPGEPPKMNTLGS